MVRINVTALVLSACLLPCLTGQAQALLFCGGLLSGAVSVSASALSFGTYAPASAAAASADVTVRCSTLGVDLLPSFTVALIAASSADPNGRHMNNGAAQLDYNVYTSAGYATVWGDGTGGSVTQGFNSLLALGTIDFTAWGRVPAGQYVPAGGYADQITVQISY